MKKGMSNILVLVLALVNLILTAVLIFTVVPSVNKTNKLIDKICQIVDLNVGENSGNSSDDVVTLADLDSRVVKFGTGEDAPTEATITLKSDDIGETGSGSQKAHHIKIGVVLNLNKKHEDYTAENIKLIDTAMTNIGSTITSVISDYTYSEVSREKMEADILKALRDLFNSDFIYSVEFNVWQVQ